MIVVQRGTYRDGTEWLRWLDPDDYSEEARAQRRDPRVAVPNCAFCCPDDPMWSDAPTSMDLPKVDLIYECESCGHTTYQGRLGPAH